MNKPLSSLVLSTIIGMSASSCERQVTPQNLNQTPSSESYLVQESNRVPQPTNPVYNLQQAVSQPSQEPLQSPTPTTTDYLALLHAAKEITVSERSLHFNKHYDIIVNNTVVATVTGKLVTAFGEKFTLTTIDGKVLASESESIRVLRWSRQASVKDSTGNITGYFGEERLSDFFSVNYIIHFYDKDKKEVGQSQKFSNSSWFYDHNLVNSQGEAEYNIDKETTLIGGDTYHLTIHKKHSQIPLEQALFIVCIEDAIGDAQEKKKHEKEKDD